MTSAYVNRRRLLSLCKCAVQMGRPMRVGTRASGDQLESYCKMQRVKQHDQLGLRDRWFRTTTWLHRLAYLPCVAVTSMNTRHQMFGSRCTKIALHTVLERYVNKASGSCVDVSAACCRRALPSSMLAAAGARLAVRTPTDKVSPFTKALTHELATKEPGKQANTP